MNLYILLYKYILIQILSYTNIILLPNIPNITILQIFLYNKYILYNKYSYIPIFLYTIINIINIPI